jgi:hypothetical protein
MITCAIIAQGRVSCVQGSNVAFRTGNWPYTSNRVLALGDPNTNVGGDINNIDKADLFAVNIHSQIIQPFSPSGNYC